MGLTFHDLQAGDVARTFINPDEFGVPATFMPSSGDSRSISVIVDRTRLLESRQGGKDTSQTIEVSAAEDEITGFGELTIGDCLVIDGVKYAWTGDETERGDGMVATTFVRKSPFEVGGNRRQ